MHTRPRDARALQRLRERNERRNRTPSTRARFDSLAANLRRDARHHAGVGDAWAATCPPQLARNTRVLGLSRGTLKVGVPNDALRHQLDRHLREGGLQQLAQRSPATVRRVQLLHHTMQPHPPPN